MKNFKNLLVNILAVLLITLIPTAVAAEDIIVPENDVNDNLSYNAHVQNIGWMDIVPAGEVAGTTGRALNVESFHIYTNLDPQAIGVNYSCHVQNLGWQEEVSQGAESGTVGQNLPIEAVKIYLTGADAPSYDLYYRVHAANFGWMGWAKNGEIAGTTGCAFPIEALQILAVPAGEAAPGSTENAHATREAVSLSLRTHVENIGWTDPVPGGISGTTGSGLKIEAVDAQVNDPFGSSGIRTQAYVENQGWQNLGPDNTPVGTTGQNLRIEALRFVLSGAASQLYDVNYRTHVANLGWLGWTSNGRTAGTKDGALRIEAIDLQLVPKGSAAVTDNAYREIDHSIGVVPPAPNSIVINIDRQRMGYYRDYNLVINTNVVTGMKGIDDTHRGDFTVMEKLPNYRTVGPGYDAVVNYWLTLYVGDIYGFSGGHTVDRVGIHDAGWRSNWASNAYTFDGSHGCVNTPYSAMDYIFNNVEVGTPVKIR